MSKKKQLIGLNYINDFGLFEVNLSKSITLYIFPDLVIYHHKKDKPYFFHNPFNEKLLNSDFQSTFPHYAEELVQILQLESPELKWPELRFE